MSEMLQSVSVAFSRSRAMSWGARNRGLLDKTVRTFFKALAAEKRKLSE